MNKKYNEMAFSWYKKAYTKKLLNNKPVTKKEFSSFMKATIFSQVSDEYSNQVNVIIHKTFNYAKDRVKKKVAQIDKSNAIQKIKIELPNLELNKALKFAILNDLISCNNTDSERMTNFLKILDNDNNQNKKQGDKNE
ncbi:hypothetical protein [Campylobacter sp. RM12651]|uniref:hypothetical protein n=1 Tax=Campylobacter sp. RM12651 TaxID=1660079 RepID=UPI001EFBFA41|nr:hypothetical protein [Campylobacter sp. RM12651]ULO03745.1 hypothetical protein AVBRAN_1290 [Campylobacter sp. RM12651]